MAFEALRRSLSEATVGGVVSYAPPDRLWVQVYFNSIFSAVTFGAHLVDEGALLPDALVARIISSAVNSIGGCWDAHGADWIKAVFPELPGDCKEHHDILRAWRNEAWVLAFLRHSPTSEAQSFGPVFLFSKRPGRMADALVVLPLPVAADVALLCGRATCTHARNPDRGRALSSQPPTFAGEAAAEPARDFFTTGVWALFGMACPKRPLAFTDFQSISEPSWREPEKRLAWLRLSGRDWPTLTDVKRRFDAANVTLPERNPHWSSVSGSASNLSVACAVPPSTRTTIGRWHMREKYSDKGLQKLANEWDSRGEETHCLSSYLLACADSTGEIHSVLKQVILQADPVTDCTPWVDWPSEPGSLQPPAPRQSGDQNWVPMKEIILLHMPV